MSLSAEERRESAIQKALRVWASIHTPPEAMYAPSPGQLLDHVHHRVARIAARVVEVELRAARAENENLRAALSALADAGEEASDFTSGPAVTIFNVAMTDARSLLAAAVGLEEETERGKSKKS